jgi:hypothetical protein
LKVGGGNKGPDLREPWDEGGDCVDAVLGVSCLEFELCVEVDVSVEAVVVRVGAGLCAVDSPALSVLTAVAQAEKTRAITIYMI